MNEAMKSLPSLRRNGDLDLLRGHGIDIGAGDSPLRLGPEASVDNWDVDDGDAQAMAGVPDETYDFVFSSHCLEHLRDVGEALRNWARILKPGCGMVVIVPDAVLYEHGRWPSIHNADHRHRFTLFDMPGLEGAIGLRQMRHLAQDVGLVLRDARLTCDGYNFDGVYSCVDQTWESALAQVTFVFHKP